MAEIRNACNFNGVMVNLSESEMYDLNYIFCSSGQFGGTNYKNLNHVLQTVLEIGMHSIKEELETHETLSSIANQKKK